MHYGMQLHYHCSTLNHRYVLNPMVYYIFFFFIGDILPSRLSSRVPYPARVEAKIVSRSAVSIPARESISPWIARISTRVVAARTIRARRVGGLSGSDWPSCCIAVALSKSSLGTPKVGAAPGLVPAEVVARLTTGERTVG